MENTILRVVAGLIFGFLALLGGFMLLAAVAQVVNLLRSLFWPSVAGTITESVLEIQNRPAGSEGTDFVTHSARIAYTYEVDGRVDAMLFARP